MKNNKHLESFGEFNENLNISDVSDSSEFKENLNISGFINRLSNWHSDRVRKKERLKIFNKYKSGDISYDEYVKQRKELEERYKEEDKDL